MITTIKSGNAEQAQNKTKQTNNKPQVNNHAELPKPIGMLVGSKVKWATFKHMVGRVGRVEVAGVTVDSSGVTNTPALPGEPRL